ncbi:MAG: tripartite tricarboxylate transporter substrate binding protein [Rubrivivax sp.]|nr:tripartite tricarboxylate transporter substrate binding protein [Burkholderiales bacterium]MCW5633476.1 tripartite tricarboxylate transporter substrate binding protein [Rubrivivax sp.]
MPAFISRRFAAMVVLCTLGCRAAFAADEFPSRALRMIVPYSAGSFSDALCRELAAGMSAHLNQPVTIDNIPGAGATIGMARAKAAPPDGYTIVYVGSSAIINVSLMPQVPYDPLKDFRYIGLIGYTNYVLASHPGRPFADFAGMLARAKAAPNTLTIASPGNGTASHLSAEIMKKAAGINARHVPYKGSSPAVNDLVAGHVDMMMDPQTTLGPFVRAGRLRGLAVTGSQRMRELPDVPTLSELGIKGLEVPLGWFGMAAPAGTPDAVMTRLHAAMSAAMERSTGKLGELGVQIGFGSADAFRRFVESEVPRYGRIVDETGVKLE